MTVQTESLETIRDNALSAWESMHGFVVGILDAIPEEHWFAQAGDGTNHTMWITGHLAFAYGVFIEGMGGKSGLGDCCAGLFGMGTEPLTDPSAYPPVAEVRAEFDRTAELFKTTCKGLSGDDLAAEFVEVFRESCPTRAHAPLIASFHDGLHGGQLATIRKSLGMTPTMA